jgi:hypothetical protein
MGTTDDESVKQIRAAEAAKKAEEKRAHDASVRLEPTTADLEILSGGITSTKLAAAKFEPIKWFIDDLLPEGLAILAGKSGSGKSYLALQIACDVAAGKPLFGKFPTRPLRVAYLSYEDDLRICQKRQAECGFPISDNLKIFPKFETGTKGLRLLEILAKEEGVSLVIAFHMVVVPGSRDKRTAQLRLLSRSCRRARRVQDGCAACGLFTYAQPSRQQESGSEW